MYLVLWLYDYYLELSNVVNHVVSFLHDFLFFLQLLFSSFFVSISLYFSLIYSQLSGRSIILVSVFKTPVRDPPGGPWPLVLIQIGHPLSPLHSPLFSPVLDPLSSGFLFVYSHFGGTVFLKNFYLFIYLFLAVLGLHFCTRAFSSCGKRGPLFIAVRGPLTIVASLVAEHRLQTRRLSSCSSRA